jgi:macrodomain Ter protein organizer (MatP/YcbG family)
MLNLRIDWEVWDSLRELAQQRGVTASDLVRGMIDFAMTDESENVHLIEIKQTVSKLNALVDTIEANPPYSRRRRNVR